MEIVANSNLVGIWNAWATCMYFRAVSSLQPNSDLSHGSKSLPTGNCPRALSRPDIVSDAREAPTQFDRGSQFSAFIHGGADGGDIGFGYGEHPPSMATRRETDKRNLCRLSAQQLPLSAGERGGVPLRGKGQSDARHGFRIRGRSVKPNAERRFQFGKIPLGQNPGGEDIGPPNFHPEGGGMDWRVTSENSHGLRVIARSAQPVRHRWPVALM